MSLFRSIGLMAALVMAAALTPAQATEQTLDTLRVNGRVAELTAQPLDAYLEAHPRWEDDLPHLMSSANWRGYVADWEIKDGRLLLTRIYRDVHAEREFWWQFWRSRSDTHDHVMPGTPLPTLATWFSDILVVVHPPKAADPQSPKMYEVFRIHRGVVQRHHGAIGVLRRTAASV